MAIKIHYMNIDPYFVIELGERSIWIVWEKEKKDDSAPQQPIKSADKAARPTSQL